MDSSSILVNQTSPAPNAAAPADRAATGFYCSTSGTYFVDKESLSEHYKSDFHRYNLKRKVAGLPSVTKEWFDARKAQLSSVSTGAGASGQKVWVDPLTKKRFRSENTYQAHVRSKKYQELVRASGAPAPAPVIMLKSAEPQAAAPVAATPAAPQQAMAPRKATQQQPGGFTVRPPQRPQPAAAAEAAAEDGTDAEDDDGSGWETASDVSTTEAMGAGGADAAADDEQESEEGEEGEWEEWDVRRSLFDNREAPTFEDNLEYMYRTYGFYQPDADKLTDPQGLLRYLGQKLRYGGIPIGVRGDDTRSRRFRSLHAVQRHMVDTNQCKMVFEGNEEEYADFYSWAGEESEEEEGGVLTVANADGAPSGFASGGYELVVGGGAGGESGASRVLGSREFARYYRQKPKPLPRPDVEVNALVAQYRALGIDTKPARPPAEVRAAQRHVRQGERARLNMALRRNKNDNLPNNVPY